MTDLLLEYERARIDWWADHPRLLVGAWIAAVVLLLALVGAPLWRRLWTLGTVRLSVWPPGRRHIAGDVVLLDQLRPTGGKTRSCVVLASSLEDIVLARPHDPRAWIARAWRFMVAKRQQYWLRWWVRR